MVVVEQVELAPHEGLRVVLQPSECFAGLLEQGIHVQNVLRLEELPDQGLEPKCVQESNSLDKE